MAKPEKLTEQLGTANAIVVTNKFGDSLRGLLKVLGVHRQFPMRVGDRIQMYKTVATIEGEPVEKGDIIPLTEVKVEPAEAKELKYVKKRKAVAFEDVQKYGTERAITMTDEALIRAVQKEIKADIFASIKAAQKTAEGVGLQGALAQGWGNVQTIFEDDDAAVVAFINPLDVADYTGNASVTMQKAFGLTYLTNFLGADVAIVTSQIEKGAAYVTADENLIFGYADLRNGEAAREFDLITDETGLIGIRREQTGDRLTSETTVVASGALTAERLDGVVKVTINEAVTA